MINIIFLKKKKYINNVYNNNDKSLPKIGEILFLKYISLDRDFIYKYKVYGICIGTKKKNILTSFYLRALLSSIRLKISIFLYSPFIYNYKLYSQNHKNFKKSKIYKLIPKIKYFKQILTDFKITM